MSASPNQEDVNHLNSFLRGELSAVETYTQALEKADDDKVRNILVENLSSHRGRAQVLSEKIRELQGEPADSSGPWGAFAKAVEGGAKIFGETAAVSALEEGEDHGLRNYREDVSELSPDARSLVTSRLLPEQQRTHDALSRLKTVLQN